MIPRTEAFVCVQDTAGQERFRTITSSYYRGAQGVILGTFLLPTRMQRTNSNVSIVIQCTMFPTGRPLRPSLGGTVNLKLMFPNPLSRSSSATRLTRSAVYHLHSTPFLTQVQEFSRQVPASEGEAFARRMNSLFIETSAKTAVGVSEAFKEVAEKILDTPELWAPVTGQDVGSSAGGNRTRTNDNSMPGSINLNSNEPQSQEGCPC